MGGEYVRPNAVARNIRTSDGQQTVRFSLDREASLRLALALTNAIVDPATNEISVTLFKKDKNVMVTKYVV